MTPQDVRGAAEVLDALKVLSRHQNCECDPDSIVYSSKRLREIARELETSRGKWGCDA